MALPNNSCRFVLSSAPASAIAIPDNSGFPLLLSGAGNAAFCFLRLRHKKRPPRTSSTTTTHEPTPIPAAAPAERPDDLWLASAEPVAELDTSASAVGDADDGNEAVYEVDKVPGDVLVLDDVVEAVPCVAPLELLVLLEPPAVPVMLAQMADRSP